VRLSPSSENDALVALGIAAAVNGHGEMAIAKEPAVGRKLRKPLGREPGIAAQPSRHLIVGDEEIDRAVGRGLEDELTLIFERGAKQRRERNGLAEKLRDRLWIIVAREDDVDRRPKFHEPAENVGVLGLER